MSIQDEIEQLRQELPWVYSNPPHILEIRENEKVSIVAADRPDKAVIIGPGGYIAGNLAKRIQKPLSITAYTDTLIKDFRKSESQRLVSTLSVGTHQKEILKTLEKLLHGIHYPQKHITVAVALSGGRDSLATAVLLNNLFRVEGFTVYPSDMILPPHIRDAIDETAAALTIDHTYLPADFSDIITKSLDGRIHPCGHCHRTTSDVILQQCSARSIPAVAFGELLPTGSQSLRMVTNVLLVNLPAFLALTKRDTTVTASAVREYSSFTVGCPLLKAVHNLYPHMKLATAKRIFREVRAGVLEPGEASKYLKSLL
jgi:predicted PP-loop superfamily ATPase